MLKFELSLRGLLVVGLVLAALWMVTQIWQVVLLVIVSVIFMAALLPYVELLTRWRLPRAAAVLVMLFLVLGAIGGLFAVVIPAMIDEFQVLRDEAPGDLERLEGDLRDLGIDVELSDRFEAIDWGEVISGRAAFDYGQRVVFGVVSAVTVAVLTAYLLNDAPRMKQYFFGFVPDAHQAEAERLLHALGRVVGGYIRGQAITSAVIGLYTTVVLALMGVDNALAFGVLAAFADVIPLIGAFIAIIPPVLAAFSDSTTVALVVLVALLVYQQFEDRFLVPRVYGSTLGLQPLVVLLAVLAGGELFGVPGILLALPATAAGKVLLDFYLSQRGRSTPFDRDVGNDEVAAPDVEPVEKGR